MEPNNQEISHIAKEILEAMNVFSMSVDKRFETQDSRFDVVQMDLAEIKHDIRKIDQKMDYAKHELISEIDRFVILHQTIDIELVSLRARIEEKTGLR